jgi:hypothetical protein
MTKRRGPTGWQGVVEVLETLGRCTKDGVLNHRHLFEKYAHELPLPSMRNVGDDPIPEIYFIPSSPRQSLHCSQTQCCCSHNGFHLDCWRGRYVRPALPPHHSSCTPAISAAIEILGQYYE